MPAVDLDALIGETIQRFTHTRDLADLATDHVQTLAHLSADISPKDAALTSLVAALLQLPKTSETA
jgi:hypothetical protein